MRRSAVLLALLAMVVVMAALSPSDAEAKKGHKHKHGSVAPSPPPSPPPPPVPTPVPTPTPPPPWARGHVKAVQTDLAPDILNVQGYFSIHQPQVNPDAANNNYSLTQLWIANDGAGTGGRGAIELGWVVAPFVYKTIDPSGYLDPHLFLNVRDSSGNSYSIRHDGQYGFTSYANSSNNILKPDANLEQFVQSDGVPLQTWLISIEYSSTDNRWYLWFGNYYIGYIDANWFQDNPQGSGSPPLTAADNVAWYGEVGSYSPVPCAAMGNGTYGTQVGSARIEDMRVNHNPANPTLYPFEYEQYWNGRLVDNVLYYGGPNPC